MRRAATVAISGSNQSQQKCRIRVPFRPANDLWREYTANFIVSAINFFDFLSVQHISDLLDKETTALIFRRACRMMGKRDWETFQRGALESLTYPRQPKRKQPISAPSAGLEHVRQRRPRKTAGRAHLRGDGNKQESIAKEPWASYSWLSLLKSLIARWGKGKQEPSLARFCAGFARRNWFRAEPE